MLLAIFSLKDFNPDILTLSGVFVSTIGAIVFSWNSAKENIKKA